VPELRKLGAARAPDEVDAPGRELVGTKGEYPLRAPVPDGSTDRRPRPYPEDVAAVLGVPLALVIAILLTEGRLPARRAGPTSGRAKRNSLFSREIAHAR